MIMTRILFLLFSMLLINGCRADYDVIIRNGKIVDGSGSAGYTADIGISNGKIVMIEEHISEPGALEIDARGQVVCPGFIDILSWACGPVLYDSEVRSVVQQGITTTVFGEGWSMGPVNDNVREGMKNFWMEYNLDYSWHTLGEYLDYVEKKGTAVNIASFIGATTVRMYVVGFDDRPATAEEMEKMKLLVSQAMEEGALGLGSSLVYTPAFYASTEELIELSKVAAVNGGIYISHVRGEGADLLTSVRELLTISKEAEIPAEIYHFKAAGKDNWHLLDDAISLIEEAHQQGLDITADIYPYTAAATGLDAMIPPWAKEGGDQALIRRLKDPQERKKMKQDILTSKSGWENFYQMSGGGKNILVSYLSEKNKSLQGKSIEEIARIRKEEEIDTIFDLLEEEEGYGGGIYFLMSEENVKKKMQLPWVSFCTDEDAYRPEGLMGKRSPHPRAYGTFPRVLGKYVREEKVLPLQEAIRKMTSLPAARLGFSDRGLLKTGMAADIVVFDSAQIKDQATYLNPHQYPTGISHVFVNGIEVVRNGKHTGALPGKALKKRKTSNPD
jgi:N-acyl-D-amino-acid deacylase